MGETLVQQVIVSLGGSGNLTGSLQSAKSAADSLNVSVQSVKASVASISRNNPDLGKTTVTAPDYGSGKPTSVGAASPAGASSVTEANKSHQSESGSQKPTSVAASTSAVAGAVESVSVAASVAALVVALTAAANALAKFAGNANKSGSVGKSSKSDEEWEKSKNPNHGKSVPNGAMGINDTMPSVRLEMAKAQAADEAKNAAKAMKEAAMKWNLTVGGAAFAGGMGAMTGLGGMFSPWELERFHKATRDLGASIGRDLLPYLQMATSVVRAAADAWVSLPAPIRSIVAGGIALVTVLGGGALAMGLLRKGISWVSATAMSAVGSLTKQAAANNLMGASSGAGILGFAARFVPLLAAVGVIGMAVANRDENSSYGMAATGSSVTSPEAYLNEIQIGVLKASQTEAEKQTGLLQGILGEVSKGPAGKVFDKSLSDHYGDWFHDTWLGDLTMSKESQREAYERNKKSL